MERACKTCRHFTEGVTDAQRKSWSVTNWGYWADGVCHKEFPRGYIGRKPPHPARAVGRCFQYERKDSEQVEMEV